MEVPDIFVEDEEQDEISDVDSIVESVLVDIGSVADEWQEFLENVRTSEERLDVIAKYMNIHGRKDELQAGILLDYYAGIIDFCLGNVLSSDQSLVLFNIGRDVLQSATTHHLKREESINEFKGRVLRRSTGSSDCIYDKDEAMLIADYFATTLYQHYNLYLLVFSHEQDMEARRMEVNVQCAVSPLPLSEAVTEDEYNEIVETELFVSEEAKKALHDAEIARLAAEHEEEDAMYRAAAAARLKERQQSQLLNQVLANMPDGVPDLDSEGWTSLCEIAGSTGDIVSAKLAEIRQMVVETQNEQYLQIQQRLAVMEAAKNKRTEKISQPGSPMTKTPSKKRVQTHK